jgi:iron complex outermembrane receptor protein
MKTFSLIHLTFFCAAFLFGQQTGTLIGKISDLSTKQPLDGANVLLQRTTIGTTTANDGSFRLENIPAGDYTLVVTYIGYIAHRQFLHVSGGVTGSVDISLEPTLLPGQTMIVTAMRAKERETPATFSSVQKDEIQRRYTFQDIPLMLAELPSTTYYSESGNGVGYNYINIRGFDQRRISVMVNGIPQNDPEDHNVYWLDFPDLLASTDDIQVQRGAGSAFYGPPAIGGSVNLTTSSFSLLPKISLEAGTGSYSTNRFSFGVNSGLIGNRYLIFGRLSKLKTSGYRDQSWSDFGSYYLSAVRYDDDMVTQINLYGGPFKDHLSYYGIAKSDLDDKTKRRANPIQRPEEIENFSQPHFELLHEWRINDRVTLNNAFFLVLGEGFYDYDASWADTTMLRLSRAYGFTPTDNPVNSLVRSYVDNTQYGWMPRATFNYERGTTTVGIELRIHRSQHWGNIRWAQNLPPEWNNDPRTADYRFYEYRGGKDIITLYAHNVYELQPNISLMANLQYAFNRYKISNEKFIGTTFDVDYHFLNPRVGLNINFTDQLNAYINVAYTSREPRLNNLYYAEFSWTGEVPQFKQTNGNYDFSQPLVKPEKLFDLELGTASISAAGKLSANLYWMNFRDEIVSSGQLDLFGQPITGNADQTRHVGLELSGSTQLSEGLTIQANATFSRNTIVHHTTYTVTYPADAPVITPVSLDGKRLGGFPGFLFNTRLTYQKDAWFATFSLQHVGEQFTDNFEDPNRRVDAYAVANVLVGVRWKEITGLSGLELRFQVNNLFDALYAPHGEGAEYFPAAERNIFASLKLEL